MSARLARVAAVIASALFVVGCATGPSPTTPPSSAPVGSVAPSGAPAPASAAPSAEPSVAPSAVLLKVTSEGGFINPAATLNALPLVEVLADGRILTPVAIDEISPLPLLPRVEVRETGPGGAAAILAAIRTAGLDRPATGGPGIPGDSGTDIFSATIGGETIETRISANGPGVGGPGVGGPGVGGSPDPGRTAAFDLLGRLQDPAVAWGDGPATRSDFAPTGYRIFVLPGAPTPSSSTVQPPLAWPLATPLDAFGTPAVPDRGIAGLRQAAVLGADAATLRPLFAKATVETPFTSGSATYTLMVRPLLPDETGG